MIAQRGRSTKPHPWELGDIPLQFSVGIGVLVWILHRLSEIEMGPAKL